MADYADKSWLLQGLSTSSIGEVELEAQVREMWEAWRNAAIGPEEREDIYRQQLFPLAARIFFLRERPKLVELTYDLLISTVGLSFEPVVLTILTLQPERIVLLCTDETRHLLGDIQAFTGITPASFAFEVVEKQEMTDVYEKVKKHVRPGWKVAVDLTGGTKVMSAGAAIGAVLNNPDIFYVGSQLDPSLHKPVAGSERLLRVQNPLTINLDLEVRTALDLWQNGNFGVAGSILLNIVNQVEDPRKVQIWGNLAKAYGEWELFHFAAAEEGMKNVLALIPNYRRCANSFGLLPYRECLEQQYRILDVLSHLNERKTREDTVSILKNKELIVALLFSLWGNAVRCEEQHRFDVAALLLYRLIETLSQRRLALRGFDTSQPDYCQLGPPETILMEMQNCCRRARLAVPGALPEKVALTPGYTLLQVVGDPWPTESLSSLSGRLLIRNNSIYAHGFNFIKEDAYRDYRRLVENLLDSWCRVEAVSRAEQETSCRFLRPGDFVEGYQNG